MLRWHRACNLFWIYRHFEPFNSEILNQNFWWNNFYSFWRKKKLEFRHLYWKRLKLAFHEKIYVKTYKIEKKNNQIMTNNDDKIDDKIQILFESPTFCCSLIWFRLHPCSMFRTHVVLCSKFNRVKTWFCL